MRRVSRWVVIFFLFTSCLLVVSTIPSLADPTASFSFSAEDPTNESVDVDLPANIYIEVEDDQGNDVNISFACNSTGSWVNFSWWNDTTDLEFEFEPDNDQDNGPFLEYEKTYWWRVYADAGGYYYNETYWFTTAEKNAPDTLFINVTTIPNGSTNVNLNPEYEIEAEEKYGNLVNWSVATNISGDWVETYWVNYTNDDSFGPNIEDILGQTATFDTTYYIMINVSCGSLEDKSNWFKFTTRSEVTPSNPYPITAELLDADSIKIDWTKGTDADRTVVIYKAGSYPTSVTDGTVVYNDTGSTYTHNSYTSNYHYKLYSYESTDKTYSSGSEVYLGSLTVQVFDESDGGAITGWDILITPTDGQDPYQSDNNDNPTVLDVDEVPNGDNVYIYINKTGYRSQIYVMDLPEQTHNILNAYLCSTGTSNLYLIQVENEVGTSIEGAKVNFKRYINDTTNYGNTTIHLTDGAGQCTPYLVPNVLYLVNITKDGYANETTTMIPDPDYYGLYYPKTFTLYFEDIPPSPGDVEPADVIFTGEYSYNVDVGVILWFNYTDASDSTIDSDIYVYGYNITNGTSWTVDPGRWVNSQSGEDDDEYSIELRFIMSRIGWWNNSYIAVLHYNSSLYGHQTKTLYINPVVYTVEGVPPDHTVKPTYITTPDRFEDLWDDIVGTNPFGWGNFMMFLFLVGAMFYADQRDSNIILIFLGGLFLFINVVVGFNDTLQTVSGGVIPILFIVVGIIGMWNDSRKKGWI